MYSSFPHKAFIKMQLFSQLHVKVNQEEQDSLNSTIYLHCEQQSPPNLFLITNVKNMKRLWSLKWNSCQNTIVL